MDCKARPVGLVCEAQVLPPPHALHEPPLQLELRSLSWSGLASELRRSPASIKISKGRRAKEKEGITPDSLQDALLSWQQAGGRAGGRSKSPPSSTEDKKTGRRRHYILLC